MSQRATSRPAGPARPGGDSYDNIEPWFDKLNDLDIDDPLRHELRDHIIELCLPLAEHIARRYSDRGEAFDDLVQTARMGLVLAVDRFDADRGTAFLSFAVPTIMGEVRRHFRDHTWAARVPRRYKDFKQQLATAGDTLAQRLGHTPNAGELAAELGVETTYVTQALVAANAYRTDSLDTAAVDSDEATPLTESLGADEPCYELLEQAAAVRPLIADLSEQDRRLLVMRYFESQTQSQIADELGVSQMQISRLLARILDSLRDQVWAEYELADA
ncbi:SigB/SigF/SigG family RNA polymerase sigma factor [Nocardia veterana]|uniref:SigB/SigF/SigG family RNA polymerase sigma factor n=1 Tax=Nocardia veterana TaxID=132249 RepID=A0A7X6RJ82_9NOCA|nr:SigB/SigF/SigG family RNA polymerase sigma factor [Nocardia veterana]NKY87319.1 SigB/SigF/SigG family RNA polymerase sigma factor [Nocardia veterana]